MAFLANQEEENKQFQTSQGGGGTISGGSGGSQPQNSAPRGSGFVNLQNFVNANQGSGGQMADKTKGFVDSKDQAYQSSSSALQNNANNEIKATNASGVVKGLQTNPASVDAKQYQSVKAGYQGPMDSSGVTGFSDAQKNFNTANQNIQGFTGDLASRGQVIRNAYGANTNRGEANFDGFLTGASDRGREVIGQTKDTYKDYNSRFSNVMNAIDKQASKAQNASIKNQQDVQAAYQAAQQAAQQQYQQAQNQAGQLQQALSGGSYDRNSLNGMDANLRAALQAASGNSDRLNQIRNSIGNVSAASLNPNAVANLNALASLEGMEQIAPASQANFGGLQALLDQWGQADLNNFGGGIVGAGAPTAASVNTAPVAGYGRQQMGGTDDEEYAENAMRLF